jgi:hypothetical protein
MNGKQRRVLAKFNTATDTWIEALEDLARYHNIEPSNAVTEVDRLRINICRTIERYERYNSDYGAE